MFEFLKKQLHKKETREFVMPKNLSKEEQKQVRAIIDNAKKDDGVPRTAQQSIPFDRMLSIILIK